MKRLASSIERLDFLQDRSYLSFNDMHSRWQRGTQVWVIKNPPEEIEVIMRERANRKEDYLE